MPYVITYEIAARPPLSAQERVDFPTLINLKTMRGEGRGYNPLYFKYLYRSPTLSPCTGRESCLSILSSCRTSETRLQKPPLRRRVRQSVRKHATPYPRNSRRACLTPDFHVGEVIYDGKSTGFYAGGVIYDGKFPGFLAEGVICDGKYLGFLAGGVIYNGKSTGFRAGGVIYDGKHLGFLAEGVICDGKFLGFYAGGVICDRKVPGFNLSYEY
ncbi:MAG: hypothetical protein LBL33_01030 [Tannerella sp.]|jgi:hypothetical protein|nr:hypothetical protein [Tannerella sp.]